MASLFSTAIAAICISTQGNFHQACHKAIDAGTRQIGVRQQVDMAEDKTVHFVESSVRANLTKEEISAASAGLFIYKTTKDRKLSLGLPNLSICNALSADVSLDSYKLNVKWDL